MRYFIITYLRKANGQIDEATQVTKRVKPRDLQTASVILDFKDMKVLKASVSGTSIERNWDTIHDYYVEHYEHIFRRLHNENGREIELIKEDAAETVDSQPSTAG